MLKSHKVSAFQTRVCLEIQLLLSVTVTNLQYRFLHQISTAEHLFWTLSDVAGGQTGAQMHQIFWVALNSFLKLSDSIEQNGQLWSREYLQQHDSIV